MLKTPASDANGLGKEFTNETEVAGADPMQYNIEAIAKLEQAALQERSAAEYLSDTITRFTGSIGFVVFHVLLFAFWLVINLNFIPGVPAFDPFPFGILTLIVSSEGVFLAIFILISQNRITRQADRRAHLDLQINLLTEREITLMLRMQKKMCEHLGLEIEQAENGTHHLMKEMNVEHLVNELEEKLPTA
ncbi:MAG TPA: DUF1003 domain-containing protein [Pyrinomonadaceae bacterium]|jgi:uncharacterized membrane protein